MIKRHYKMMTNSHDPKYFSWEGAGETISVIREKQNPAVNAESFFMTSLRKKAYSENISFNHDML